MLVRPVRQASRLVPTRLLATSRSALLLLKSARTALSAPLAPAQLGHTHRRSCSTLFGAILPGCAYHRKMSSASSTAEALAKQQPSTDYRLGSAVKPIHYDLVIKSDLEQLAFEGKAQVEVEILQETKEITLHARKPLVVRSASLKSSQLKTTSEETSTDLKVDEDLERVTATFATPLPAGSKATITYDFSGEIEGSMQGYYRSSYDKEDGSKGSYALTQFEPTDARRAFPCFDEPALKATFTLDLIHRKGTVALGNMNAINEIASDGSVTFLQSGSPAEKGPETKSEWLRTSFAKTPKMSTYLVAYANGEFVHLESAFTSPLTNKSVPMRIYTTPEHIHQAQFALDVKQLVLPVYERIFDIAYPLPKLDTLVAADFDAGAMENWGLITGRTAIYLYDDERSGISGKKLTAGVQSHEVAHQWFGNIVSPGWWDNLWLNEAFATLMGEVIIIHEVWPEWKIHSAFISKHLNAALALDSQRSSHPIEMPCPDPKLINQIFDAISYSKGASVLKMLSNLIGEKVFLKGVSIYLKAHLYGNSQTKDLWAGIAESSGLDVAKIMSNWTLKTGFPVINVEETSTGITVRQNRFLSTGDPTPEEDETIWYVPLMLKTMGASSKPTVDNKAILDKRELSIKIDNVTNASFKLNAETAGVYRVRYQPERLAKLGEEAAKPNSALSLNDRMGLVQDAFTLARAGYGETSGALALVNKLNGETENLVWTEINAGVSDIDSAWWEEPKDVRDGIAAFRRHLMGPIARKLSFEVSKSDAPDVRELRALVIGSAAASHDQEIIDECIRRFDAYSQDGDDHAIPGDLLRPIFVVAVRYGAEKQYDAALQVMRRPPTPQHKVAAIFSLAFAQDEALLKRTFSLISDGEIKTQDLLYIFGGLGSNAASRRMVWTWLQENYDLIYRRFDGGFQLGRIIGYAFEGLSTTKDADAVEAFFKEKDTAAYHQALKQGLDSVRAKAAWLSRDRGDVKEWLKAQQYLA
ncbi:uncharacterized protein L969DRAFT_94837 [Mixia osmundae IAM 14324]|uniref:Aminopeptidase n=1 Tax=Mixia osmundae (strain CBS 9802 / IAM 14324 / JCM 22182 / KY 12970) TaxID=764103 RepID=G7DYZ1_MIXOS|nr:uncharacterized protein L969DRAFT_94837 [Mixia osmundae IAM 14324]KEI38632.1 hypothetical protein L969DRAFT_94837 [Mixia osmundae IAM 14324]GAA95801.1 hypothetical protein E5Q_02458 [Mixia osmundae IAM 14324]